PKRTVTLLVAAQLRVQLADGLHDGPGHARALFAVLFLQGVLHHALHEPSVLGNDQVVALGVVVEGDLHGDRGRVDRGGPRDGAIHGGRQGQGGSNVENGAQSGWRRFNPRSLSASQSAGATAFARLPGNRSWPSGRVPCLPPSPPCLCRNVRALRSPLRAGPPGRPVLRRRWPPEASRCWRSSSGCV